jgi:hypothetical protein
MLPLIRFGQMKLFGCSISRDKSEENIAMLASFRRRRRSFVLDNVLEMMLGACRR